MLPFPLRHIFSLEGPEQANPPSARQITALFASAAFFESLFLPLLLDAVLAAALLKGARLIPLLLAGAAASILGTFVWVLIGAAIPPETVALLVEKMIANPDTAIQIQNLWNDNWHIALFLAGVTPLPDPVFAAWAGASGHSLPMAFILIVASHAVRFCLMGIAAGLFARFAKKRSPRTRNALYAVCGLLILGSVAWSIAGAIA